MTKQEKKEQETAQEQETLNEDNDLEQILLEKNNQIQNLEEQLAQEKENYIRSVASSDNLRKRLEKEVEESKKFALSNFSKDLINVIENLYRSTDHITVQHQENDSIKQIFDGLIMTQNELEKVIKKYGLERINPKEGDSFDHNFHQAVSTIEDKNHATGSIITVIQAGYVLQGRLIRPALVTVNGDMN